MNFWTELKKPFVGLSPMDAITDMAYREVQLKYGKPDLFFTEFIPVEGLVRLNPMLLKDFWYSASQQPIVAQIYGNDPDLFYFSAQIAAELGFSGLDLNMGCPARSVVHRGCGAALIKNPELAVKLIAAAQKGIADWEMNGVDWGNWPVFSGDKAQKLFSEFLEYSASFGINYPTWNSEHKRESIPVSVKTRIGFDKDVVAEWIPTLLETNLAAITIHGRTLKQLYTGRADWDSIANAVNMKNSDTRFQDTLIIGNGDIKTVMDAKEKISLSAVDGVLVGRASFGNPWLISEIISGLRGELIDSLPTPVIKNIAEVMFEHARLHEKFKGAAVFVQMRKILCWYIKEIHNATDLRSELVRTNSSEEVKKILDKWKI